MNAFKQSLLVGSSIAAFAVVSGPALAQQAGGSNANTNNGNETVIVTGTRVAGMTAADFGRADPGLGHRRPDQGHRQHRSSSGPGPDGSLLHRAAVRRRHREPDADRRPSRPFAQRHPGSGQRQAPSLYRQPAGRWRLLRLGLLGRRHFADPGSARSTMSKFCSTARPPSTAPTPSPASSTSS